MRRTFDRGPLPAPLAALTLGLLWLAAVGCAPQRSVEVPCNSDFECGNYQICSYGVCEKIQRRAGDSEALLDGGIDNADDTDGGEPAVVDDAGPIAPPADAGGPIDPEPEPEPDPVEPDPEPEPAGPIPTRFDLTFDSGVHGDDALSGAPVGIHLPAGHALIDQLLDGRGVRLQVQRDGTVVQAPLDLERATPNGALVWTRLPTSPSLIEAAWLETFSPDADVADHSAEVWADYDAVYHLAGNEKDATGRWSAFEANGTEVVADCPSGACRAFDGDDWINLSSPDGALVPWLQGVGGFTVEAWVRRDTEANTEIVAIGTGATGTAPTASRAAVTYRDGAPGGFARAPDALGSKLSTAATPDALGVWHHVALVVRLPDAAGGTGSVQVFEDGEEVTYAAGPEHLFEEATTNDDGAINVALGADDDGSSLWLVGALDEVRIKPAPCTGAELRAALWTASPAFATVDEGTVVDPTN